METKRICKFCGKEFTPRSKRSRFCSLACKMKYYNSIRKTKPKKKTKSKKKRKHHYIPYKKPKVKETSKKYKDYEFEAKVNEIEKKYKDETTKDYFLCQLQKKYYGKS